MNAVGSCGHILMAEQDSAALESGDADVCLPGELSERSLIAANDALLDEFRLERLNSAHDVRLSNTPEMRMDAVKGDERLLWMR